jgi:hypothetical protein
MWHVDRGEVTHLDGFVLMTVRCDVIVTVVLYRRSLWGHPPHHDALALCNKEVTCRCEAA